MSLQVTDAMTKSLEGVHSLQDWRCWALSRMHGAERLRQSCGDQAKTLQSLFEISEHSEVKFMLYHVSGSIMLRELSMQTVNVVCLQL